MKIFRQAFFGAIASVLLLTHAQAADVHSYAETKIHAPMHRVWALMTQINQWPQWNHNVDTSTIKGEFAIGSVFEWKSGVSITSTLTEIYPMKHIAWTGVAFGTHAKHSWTFDEADGVVTVSTEETLDGWLPKLMPDTMQKNLDESLSSWLASLKAAAENGNQ
jgi:uncharacterized protein YndB with AHSA1/START domain